MAKKEENFKPTKVDEKVKPESAKVDENLDDDNIEEKPKPVKKPRKKVAKKEAANIGWTPRSEICHARVKRNGKWISPGNPVYIETKEDYENLVRNGAIVPRGELILPPPVVNFEDDRVAQ